LIYEGSTMFGFFSKAALAQQVGIRDGRGPTLAISRRPSIGEEFFLAQ